MSRSACRVLALFVAVLVLLPLCVTASAQESGNPPPPGADTMIRPEVGYQQWVTILCRYGDDPSTPHDAPWYRNIWEHPDYGLEEYWMHASYGNLIVNGSLVLGWYDLPRARSEYVPAGSTYADTDLMASDCAGQADPNIDFSQYAGIVFWFNGKLPDDRAQASGRKVRLSFDGGERTYGAVFTSSGNEFPNGVIAHEMGHSFGWGHTGSAPQDPYGSVWDVMSGISRGCFTFGHDEWCIPVHPIAIWKYRAGWIAESDVAEVTEGQTQTILLEPQTRPDPYNSGGKWMARAPILGSDTNFLTVEARRAIGFDGDYYGNGRTGVPGEGIVIHEVQTFNGTSLPSGPASSGRRRRINGSATH